MDRPKHRRLISLGLVLLAGGVLLLLGRHWTSPPEPIALPTQAPTGQLLQPDLNRAEPTTPDESAAPAAPTTAASPATSATGLRGRIVDAVTRQPVKEFEVQLIRLRREAYTEDPPITRTFTSETGRFSWGDVAAGTWRGAVQAHGYQQFNLPEFKIETDKATRELIMPLLRGFIVRGRVFELGTGAGIPDAGIWFRPAVARNDDSRRGPYSKSKEDGSFTLDGVPGGEIVLSVGAREHAFRTLEVVVDEKTQPQEIALSTGGTVAGSVRTTAGEPVTGEIWLEGESGPDFIGKTDDAGRFSFKHRGAGRYSVTADTAAGSASHDFLLREDEHKEDIVLVVGAGRSVRGVVRGLRPEQLTKAHILLRPKSDSGFFSARPDAQGAYVLNGVPPGRAAISVFSPGRQFDKTVDMPADQDLAFDIVFPPGARLSGRVTQDGKPAANKNVWMQSVEDKSNTYYRASTSEDGQYEIEGLPPGEYRLRADEDISRAITMAGDAVLNIDIPSVQLSARVVEDGGTVPLVGASVYLRGSAPETARVRGDKQTDDFGQFAFTGIEPGEIVLQVYKTGYEMHREKIAYSSPVTNKTITLRKSAGVEVRVKPGSRRFPIGFTITQYVPGNDYEIDLWMPLDREGLCHVPSALAGTTFHIGRFSGKPIVIEEWDGQSFELQ